jgi:hypothetical protein
MEVILDVVLIVMILLLYRVACLIKNLQTELI